MGDVVAVPKFLERNLEQVAAGALVLVQLLVGVVAHVPDRDVLVDPWHERLGSFARFARRRRVVVVAAGGMRLRASAACCAAAGLLCARVSSEAVLLAVDASHATRSKPEEATFDVLVLAPRLLSPALADCWVMHAWHASVLHTASLLLS